MDFSCNSESDLKSLKPNKKINKRRLIFEKKLMTKLYNFCNNIEFNGFDILINLRKDWNYKFQPKKMS